MTDKERLEKIRKGIELVDKHEVSDRTKMVDFRHWSYELLKIAVEQVERVAELERKLGEYTRKVDGLEADIQNINIDLGTVEENVNKILTNITTTNKIRD